MKSSYNSQIEYGNIIDTVTFLQKSANTRIVEFGILDGYSLDRFARNSPETAEILAYDIFDNFNGNHANKDKVIDMFSSYPNVKIEYGDFYKMHESFEDESIDILHVDIANNGDVAEYLFKHYRQKLKPSGVVLFEGGSEDRDNVEWMLKYEKPPIQSVLKKYVLTDKVYVCTIGKLPSITIIRF